MNTLCPSCGGYGEVYYNRSTLDSQPDYILEPCPTCFDSTRVSDSCMTKIPYDPKKVHEKAVEAFEQSFFEFVGEDPRL